MKTSGIIFQENNNKNRFVIITYKVLLTFDIIFFKKILLGVIQHRKKGQHNVLDSPVWTTALNVIPLCSNIMRALGAVVLECKFCCSFW
jgi:hypothetical protein